MTRSPAYPTGTPCGRVRSRVARDRVAAIRTPTSEALGDGGGPPPGRALRTHPRPQLRPPRQGGVPHTRTFDIKAATLPEVLLGEVVWVGRAMGKKARGGPANTAPAVVDVDVEVLASSSSAG